MRQSLSCVCPRMPEHGEDLSAARYHFLNALQFEVISRRKQLGSYGERLIPNDAQQKIVICMTEPTKGM